MQKVMLSLARRVVEKSARPLPGEATDLSQQYEVYLREREISAYQQSLADAFQFDEEDSERQEDANAQVDIHSPILRHGPLIHRTSRHIAQAATTSPSDSCFSFRRAMSHPSYARIFFLTIKSPSLSVNVFSSARASRTVVLRRHDRAVFL